MLYLCTAELYVTDQLEQFFSQIACQAHLVGINPCPCVHDAANIEMYNLLIGRMLGEEVTT